MAQQQQCRTKKDEWYTPNYILETVRGAMDGQISWDLASCEKANRIVKAHSFFSKEDPFQNDQRKTWIVDFWCNPPFSEIKEFAPIIARNAVKGAVITNANTSSSWWQELANSADSIVFLSKRVSFLNSETLEPITGNPAGQTLFLWRLRTQYFAHLGFVAERVRWYA